MKTLARGARKLFSRSPGSRRTSSGSAENAEQPYAKKDSESSNDLLTRIMIDKASQRVGKVVGKKIPIVGLASTVDSVLERVNNGDYTGAALEAVSGVAAQVPGVGTVASLGIDAVQLARDSKVAADEAEKSSKQSTAIAAEKSAAGEKESQEQKQKRPTKKLTGNEEFTKAKEKVDSVFSFLTVVALEILFGLLKEKEQTKRHLTDDLIEKAETASKKHIMVNDGEKAIAAILNVLDERGDIKPEVKKDIMGNAQKIFSDAKIAVHESNERALEEKERFEGKHDGKIYTKGRTPITAATLKASKGGIPDNIKKLANEAMGKKEEGENLAEEEKLTYPNREMGEYFDSPSVNQKHTMNA